MVYPGGVESVRFFSGDAELIGILYPAVGELPRPTAILLHGFPGSEHNTDIAYRLRDMGWHTFIPFFRGAWGSGGDYSIARQPDDACAALDYLLSAREAWAVDPAHVALIGYSLGSRAALFATHQDSRVGAVVSLGGIADFNDVMIEKESCEAAAPFLRGATGQSLRAQWLALGSGPSSADMIGQINQPALIVHGTADELTPYYMAEALYAASGKRATLITIEGADHTFTRHRQVLVEAVTRWLADWAGYPSGDNTGQQVQAAG
jgi:pimeloyl-ACP methyl ester carboxylesterase